MNACRLLLLPLVSLFALSACKSVVGPQTVDKSVGDTQAVGSTADMRFILARPKTDGDLLRSNAGQESLQNSGQDAAASQFNVCAEPSPDVAKAISQAITENAEATIQGIKALGGTGSVNAKQALSLQQNSAVAELGRRLATTQLLRDGLYRLCEAFSNGAISKYEYALVLSRYGDTMVTLLAIEAVSGISASQTAASIESVVVPPKDDTLNKTQPKDGGDGHKSDDKNTTDASAKDVKAARFTDASPGSVNALAGGMMKVAARTEGASMPQTAAVDKSAPDGNAKTVNTAASLNNDTAQAVVMLQKAYLEQSRYAPLLALCTAALSDSMHGPNAIADICKANMNRLLQYILNGRAPSR